MTRARVAITLLASLLLPLLTIAQEQAQHKLDSLRTLSENLKDDPCERAAVTIRMCNAHVHLEQYDSILTTAQAAAKIASEADCAKQKGTALGWQAWYYGVTNDYERMVEYNLSSYEALSNVNDTVGMAIAMTNVGNGYSMLGDQQEVLQCYLKALKLFEQANYQKYSRLGPLTYNIGSHYLESRRFDLALEYGLSALEIYEKAEHAEGIAMVQLFLARVYLELESFAKAEHYAKTSVDWYRIDGKKIDLHRAILGLGDVLMEAGKLDGAHDCFNECLQLSLIENDNSAIGLAHSGLSEIALQKASYDEAIDHGRKALQHHLKHHNFAYAIESYAVLSNALFQQEKLAEALQNADAGFHLADSLHQVPKKAQLAKILTSIHLSSGDTQRGLYYLNLERSLRDTLQKRTNREAFSKMQVAFETEKTENENLLLRLSNDSLALVQAITQAEEQRSRAETANLKTFLIASIVIGLLSIILVIITYRAYRRKKETSTILEKQDAEKALLLKEIHHRVKNNLQIIASILNLQLRSISDPVAISAVKQGQNRVRSISIIHQNLYQTEEFSAIVFADYFDQLSGSLLHMFGNGKVKVNTKLSPEDLSLDIDSAVPLGLILNELLTNTLKYAYDADESGTIRIELEELSSKQQLRLLYTDGGKGIPEDYDPAKSKSLGLLLIRELSRQLNGKITWSKTNGMTFEMLFEPTAVREAKN